MLFKTKDDAMQTMNPSTESLTEGQIGKLCELFGSALRKNKDDFPSGITQEVIENQGGVLAKDLLAVFRKYTDAVSGMIYRTVTVDRKRVAQKALDATGRKQYVNKDVVVAMPSAEGEEAKVVFFKLGIYVSDDNLDKEYELRGLKPADPFAVAAVNEADPAFADEHPNCTHWKDVKGKWCFAAFSRDDGERNLNVDRRGDGWGDYWWFAGVRK